MRKRQRDTQTQTDRRTDRQTDRQRQRIKIGTNSRVHFYWPTTIENS